MSNVSSTLMCIFECLSTLNYICLSEITAVLFCASRCIMSSVPLRITASIWPSGAQKHLVTAHHAGCDFVNKSFSELHQPFCSLCQPLSAPPPTPRLVFNLCCLPFLIPLWLRRCHPSLNSIISVGTGRQFSLPCCNPLFNKVTEGP